MVAPTHSSIARAEDETLALRGTTILVVEDEDILRQGISKMLQRKGFLVLEASDGTAALQLIRAHKGDLSVLLLDITLPGASSREVYEETKRLIPELPIIVTSAKSKEMAAAALGTSVQCFIRKPYRLSDLINMVREVISKNT
jgi:CheY-like chemotaxis protein